MIVAQKTFDDLTSIYEFHLFQDHVRSINGDGYELNILSSLGGEFPMRAHVHGTSEQLPDVANLKDIISTYRH